MATQQTTNADTDATLDVVRRVFDAFNARDREAFRALLSEEAVMDVGGTGVEIVGAAEITQAVSFTFDALPDLSIEVKRMFASGREGVAEVLREGTHTGTAKQPGKGTAVEPTGNRVHLPEVALFTVVNGEVKRMAVYADRAHAAQQFGTDD